MPIQLLPPQLANQIAAGEVVERPASVVKELVENSLDAGATQLEIEIDKGGSKRILIRDNGSGIAEQELVLALSRHATSKISSLSDLEQIFTLGFRGEALASISSVSRLTLTSKPAAQATAWQARAEGREMAVQVSPAAHPDGTSIEVLDLFFNTPARRRFLRSDKTEFSHIDELIKRLALSRFDVSWSLSHNGQQVRRLPAASTAIARQKRLAALCGRQFAEQALWIENQYDQIRLSGWILPAAACQGQPACQYSYVNGRMMRDKLLNHAIRQAYGEQLSAEQQPAFVLYLELEPGEVDVNVHPAKHEVRFHQARLVHDFVVSALSNALQQLAAVTLPVTAERQATPAAALTEANISRSDAAIPAVRQHSMPGSSGNNAYPGASRSPAWPVAEPAAIQTQLQYLAMPLPEASTKLEQPAYLLLQNRYLLRVHQQQLCVQDLAELAASYWPQQTESAPLLLPLRLTLAPAELQLLLAQADNFTQLGFDLLVRDQQLIIRAVPKWLRHTSLSDWFAQLLQQGVAEHGLARQVLEILLTANVLQAEFLLNLFSQILTTPPVNACQVSAQQLLALSAGRADEH